MKHLRKHRPDWQIDVRCGRGKHTALIGLCHRVWHDQEGDPPGPYDTSADIGWYENYSRFEDRPNTKITNCLSEVFGIPYDPSLARYEIHYDPSYRTRAAEYLKSLGAEEFDNGRYRVVIFHYEGNTSTWKKNLKHWQVKMLCDHVRQLGRVPVVFDWDRRSPLPDGHTVFCPHTGKGDLWGGFGSGDAAMIAALIASAEAYVGIDSGPGKCASATHTPTLIAWRDHHPMQFHDPANNTVHLVPTDWRNIPPAERPAIAEYFDKHYRRLEYQGEMGLVEKAKEWLDGILGQERRQAVSVEKSFVCPNGIGDVLWALHKIKAVAGGEPIYILLSGDARKEIDQRAVPFVKRFPFVQSVDVTDVPVLQYDQDSKTNDARGRYRYVDDGERSGLHFLIPNRTLERGERLEEWLPEYPVNWGVVDEFDWTGTQKGTLAGQALGDFACFYLGPETGNVDEGHNRGFLWEPKHWIELGEKIIGRGMRIVLVGAGYDRSFYERYLEEGVKAAGMRWWNMMGKMEIGETMALIRQSRFFISYQCGLGIFAHYLGVPVGMFWRPDGNSAHPKRLVSFDERMAHSWTNPRYADRYLPLIYTRCSPDSIFEEIIKRGWLPS